MSLSMGVDVAEERKGLDIVVLGTDRRVVARRDHATVADVRSMVADLQPDVVCIDSPPAWATDGPSRAAERQLRRLGITAFSTPTDPGTHPFYRWMRVGFAVFDAIADTHPRYRRGPIRGGAIEVFPEASAVLLEGHLRSKDEPKAQFRRRVLAGHGVDTSTLRTIDAVDAALASLTGLLALEGQCSAIGEPDEGVIVVPVRVLPAASLVRAGSPPALGPNLTADPAPSMEPPGERRCMCGCGAHVRRRFLPGHDAKLKSRLRRLQATGEDAASRLQEPGWA